MKSEIVCDQNLVRYRELKPRSSFGIVIGDNFFQLFPTTFFVMKSLRFATDLQK